MEYYLFAAWMFIMVFSYVKIIKAHLVTLEISKDLKKTNYKFQKKYSA
ncbi:MULTISPECIES: hypothetical protein [Arenibacter]|nr:MULTISPECIES: hypothetical protein [Arenibacter]